MGTSTVQKPNVFVQEESAALQVPTPDLPIFLTEHYGQCAEDIIVVALLRALQQRTGIDLSGEHYLEIGGNHPVGTSATFLLHRTLGMSGVIVEANPRLIANLVKGRPDDKIVHAAVCTGDSSTVHLSVSNASELSSLDRRFVLEWDQGRVGERELIEVPAVRINTLIERECGGETPLYLSVDIEGLDLDVLKDLDFSRFRPFIVQAEPSDHHIPQNSLHIQHFMETVGYRLIGKTAVNLIFADISRLETDEQAALQRQLLAQKEQLNDLSIALKCSEAELALANGRLSEYEYRYAAVEQQLASLRSRAIDGEAMRVRLERTSAELDAERHRANSLESSTSWKITAPLRALVRAIRGH
ncbi:FkbM family methyltransferase [Burkholderia multivorans]|uniref:FkbM family methyltransferase n=1 Tax=Burkholderia multivorans TaxID=87883 RepID=UPI001C252811|nr:FkbM family methyltransferase [Burkholderia multivorans]MBU9563667.1 FkbM family methyltransferase [Burkholderia multivorans]MCA8222942.1 FkbM family methyltransferase [Burkholderia multivorans]